MRHISQGELERSSLSKRSRYAPILKPEEERELFKRLAANGNDDEALKILFESHIRLVFKVVYGSLCGLRKDKSYLDDCIGAGCLGLFIAIKRYKLSKGVRLSTYAMHWIRGQVREFKIGEVSLVKVGTTGDQMKCFSNLGKIRKEIGANNEHLTPRHVTEIAHILKIPEDIVSSMHTRLKGDLFLNDPVDAGNPTSVGTEWLDFLESPDRSQEKEALESQRVEYQHSLLMDALGGLSEREKRIFTQRRLEEDPPTLEDLSKEYGISRERVRQIENKTFEKVEKRVKNLHRREIDRIDSRRGAYHQ